MAEKTSIVKDESASKPVRLIDEREKGENAKISVGKDRRNRNNGSTREFPILPSLLLGGHGEH